MEKQVKVVATELKSKGPRKSFYGKAQVLDDLKGTHYLKSYKTVMCSVDADGFVRRHADWTDPRTGRRSKTTGTHLKSFFETFGAKLEVKDFYRLPVEDRPVLVEEA